MDSGERDPVRENSPGGVQCQCFCEAVSASVRSWKVTVLTRAPCGL